MGEEQESRLHQIAGDLNDPCLQSALHIVGWLKVLNLLIEGFALGCSLERRRVQRSRSSLSPDSIDDRWNCSAERSARGLRLVAIFRKQVIEQNDVGGDLIDFTLACVIGALSAGHQESKHESSERG